MAAVAVEGALGADGPGLEQHPGGVGVAGEAGVVERDGVPAVALVDVGAAAEEEGEAGAVPRAGRLEEVPRGDLLEGHRRLEVLRVELDLDVDAAAAEMLRLVLLPRAVHFFFCFSGEFGGGGRESGNGNGNGFAENISLCGIWMGSGLRGAWVVHESAGPGPVFGTRSFSTFLVYCLLARFRTVGFF